MHTVAVLAGCKKSALARPLCSIETSVLVGASVLAGGEGGGGKGSICPPLWNCQTLCEEWKQD